MSIADHPKLPITLLGGRLVSIRDQTFVELTKPQEDVLRVLIAAFPEPVGLHMLRYQSGHVDADKILGRLAQKPDWQSVIRMAQAPWQGYKFQRSFGTPPAFEILFSLIP